jgi:hypothetical protein
MFDLIITIQQNIITKQVWQENIKYIVSGIVFMQAESIYGKKHNALIKNSLYDGISTYYAFNKLHTGKHCIKA